MCFHWSGVVPSGIMTFEILRFVQREGCVVTRWNFAVWINPHRTVSENQAILEAWNFTFQLLQYLSHILASWHWYIILIAFFTTWGQATLEDKLRKPIDFPRPCLKVLDVPYLGDRSPIQEASSSLVRPCTPRAGTGDFFETKGTLLEGEEWELVICARGKRYPGLFFQKGGMGDVRGWGLEAFWCVFLGSFPSIVTLKVWMIGLMHISSYTDKESKKTFRGLCVV